MAQAQQHGHHPPQIIALATGTLLNNGRYRIEREINRGGTAVVYSAHDLTGPPGTYVALKVMNGPDQVPIKVVKREIAFSAAARHANIVRLLDVFAEKAQLIIVWELISGPDLLDLLNEHEGRMPEAMAAFYFCQLLQAVLFMHLNGFCHRDIKPENALVERASHQLKLIDFGLSKHLESARTLGVGTPDYLSPEMLQVWAAQPNGPGSQGYDARAVDAWAMGVLMFVLVSGKYPFEDPAHPNNLAHTITNVLSGRMRPFPDHMSQGCRQLIAGLLRTNPAQRTTLTQMATNTWLLEQARLFATQVGRLDLLEPLSVYSLHGSMSGDYGGTISSQESLRSQRRNHASSENIAAAVSHGPGSNTSASGRSAAAAAPSGPPTPNRLAGAAGPPPASPPGVAAPGSSAAAAGHVGGATSVSASSGGAGGNGGGRQAVSGVKVPGGGPLGVTSVEALSQQQQQAQSMSKMKATFTRMKDFFSGTPKRQQQPGAGGSGDTTPRQNVPMQT